MNIKYINKPDDIDADVKKALDILEELQNKPDSPEFTAMMDKHRNALIQIAKEAHPGEWSYGLNGFVEFLRWMEDFYKLNENVWGMEKRDEDPKHYKNVPTRLESLQETLGYYDKWQGLEDEYVQVVYHPETYKEHDNGDGTSTIDNLGSHNVYKYGSMKRTYKKLRKAQNKYKKLFFKAVAKYLESWWD